MNSNYSFSVLRTSRSHKVNFSPIRLLYFSSVWLSIVFSCFYLLKLKLTYFVRFQVYKPVHNLAAWRRGQRSFVMKYELIVKFKWKLFDVLFTLCQVQLIKHSCSRIANHVKKQSNHSKPAVRRTAFMHHV